MENLTDKEANELMDAVCSEKTNKKYVLIDWESKEFHIYNYEELGSFLEVEVEDNGAGVLSEFTVIDLTSGEDVAIELDYKFNFVEKYKV